MTQSANEGGWTTSGGRSAASPGEEQPDEQIRQDVCDRLMQIGPADCSTIGVTVAAGVVRLEGTIADRAMGQRAEQTVRSVACVRDVDNQLQFVVRER